MWRSCGDPHFGFKAAGVRIHITRRRAVDRLQQVLFEGGHKQLLGQSFRVGGASFRNVYGMTKEDICHIGRWVSSCYRLYIQQYSRDELKRTSMLLATLNTTWRQIEI
ncbi:hypothetical protein PSHT_16518 [Puccinia striiformis]|uniref:Uncharacterized protein n=2 Tax=Puccinia striiformis TaxID=27350 RepID=A0A2S4U9K9_9BASI|nr:hypothetical protein PSHT_16518 [Puccinia striiformis]POW10835.1 hypothetical protein PSTT_05772 [Puccinia striiformis]